MPVITPDIRALDTVVCIGDSLTSPNAGNGVSWYPYLEALLRPSFPGGGAPGGGVPAPGYLSWYRGPRFINFGNAGDTTTAILARLSAVYAANPTGAILLAEDNDVTSGVTVATSTSNITAIVAGLRANCPQLRWVMLVQGPCVGELRPFGSNSNDTNPPAADDDHTLVAHDAVIRSLAASLSTGLCEFRTDAAGNGPWLTYETTYNIPNGPFFYITTDGRHLTGEVGHPVYPPSAGIGGGPFVAQQVLANCTVVAG